MVQEADIAATLLLPLLIGSFSAPSTVSDVAADIAATALLFFFVNAADVGAILLQLLAEPDFHGMLLPPLQYKTDFATILLFCHAKS